MQSNNLLSISFSIIVAGGFFAAAAHAQNPDVSLIPIAADEPIAPLGFPPLPDKLDLPIAQAARAASYNPQDTKLYGGGYIHEKTIVPRKHTADEAFNEPENAPVRQQELAAPQRRTDQSGVRSSNQSHQQNVEAPKPITVDQARSQDLSLPDDEADHSGGHASGRDRTIQRMNDQLIKRPIQRIRGRFGI